MVRKKEQMHDTAASLVNLAKLLRNRGVDVIFVNLPMSPDVERSALASLGRKIFSKAASAEDYPIELDVDQSQLRWSDGQHLDARSAVLVAASLERLIVVKRPPR